MSTYKQEIQNTVAAINARAVNHRNLVICISGLILCSIGLLFSPAENSLSLYCLTLCVPVCAVFLFKDRKLIQSWRYPILDYWKTGEIDIEILEQTILKLPNLPTLTIEGMFKTFYFRGTLDQQSYLTVELRHELSTLNETLNSEIGYRFVSRYVVIFIVLLIVLRTLNTGSWALLLSLPLPFLLSIFFDFRWRKKRNQLRLSLDQLDKEIEGSGFAVEDIMKADAVSLLKNKPNSGANRG